jgi:hypothetical protein
MSFQEIVLTVAVILLIICLIMIGWALRKNKKEVDFPPVLPICPDYWEVVLDPDDEEGKPKGCKNVNNLGNDDGDEVNYNIINYDNCRKSRWAQGKGLTWDGLTNDPNVCDNND